MRYLLQICLVFGVAACTIQTPYQPNESSSGGVSSTQIEAHIYTIKADESFLAWHDDQHRMRHFALLHAAEICLNKGFVSFVPIESIATNFVGNMEHEIKAKMFKAEEQMPPIVFSCQIIYDNLAPLYKAY